MSGPRLLLVLTFWVGLVVALPSANGQPATAEKEKQRTEAGDKADALIREGKFADAVEPATASVRLSKEIDGEKHWRTFDAEQRLKMVDTAKSFGAEKQKKLVEAIAAEDQAKKAEPTKPADALKLAQAALDGYREILGEETAEVARMWHLIGRLGLRSNDAKGAKEANEKALKIRRAVLPESHPDIGKSLNNLGIALTNLGDTKQAAKHFLEAIGIWKAALGEGDPSVAMGL